MADGMDVQAIVQFLGEAHTVVADAKAQLPGLSLKLLDVALASLGEAMERSEYAHGGLAI